MQDVRLSKVFSDLRGSIAAAENSLQATLSRIAHTACLLTGATGAAIAMWKDGAMICRARSGAMAPPLGAELSVGSGISGACLRSAQVQNCQDTENDPLVDVEVCRQLGIRSITALPIHGWREVNGILEVFSDSAFAFTDEAISLLQQLAALAEQARAVRPHGASSTAAQNVALPERRPGSRFLPASDNFFDLLAALFGTRYRPLLLAASLVSFCLVGGSMWLGWRGAKAVERHSSGSTSAIRTHGNFAPDDLHSSGAPAHASSPPESKPVSKLEPQVQELPGEKNKLLETSGGRDLVWQTDPGGEALFISNGKPSAGVPVKFAAKIDRITTNGAAKKKAASQIMQKSSNANPSPTASAENASSLPRSQ